jgi:hypothetical protein
MVHDELDNTYGISALNTGLWPIFLAARLFRFGKERDWARRRVDRKRVPDTSWILDLET